MNLTFSKDTEKNMAIPDSEKEIMGITDNS